MTRASPRGMERFCDTRNSIATGYNKRPSDCRAFPPPAKTLHLLFEEKTFNSPTIRLDRTNSSRVTRTPRPSFSFEVNFELRLKRREERRTSPMGDGGGRLARFVGALMERRIRIRSPPRVRGRRRKVRDAAVRRGVVPLLHGTRPHRPDPHAPSPLVVAVRRILQKRGKTSSLVKFPSLAQLENDLLNSLLPAGRWNETRGTRRNS